MYKKTRNRKDGTSYTVWAQDVKQLNGKYRTYTARTKKELQEKLDSVSSKSDYTVSELAQKYKSDILDVTLQQSSLRAVNTSLNAISNSIYAEINVGSINHELALKIINIDVGSSTRKGILSLLRGAFDYGVKLNLVKDNAFTNAKVLEKKNRSARNIKTYTDEEIKLIIEYSKDSMYHLVYVIAAYTGMRKGEILALTWEDIDLESRTISVSKTIEVLEDFSQAVTEPKTRRSNRIIHISDELYPYLVKYQNTGLIVNGRSSKIANVGSINKCMQCICKNAGIEYKTFHALRHTFATKLVDNGVSIRTVSNILGHDDIGVTQKYYLANNHEQEAEAIETLSFS